MPLWIIDEKVPRNGPYPIVTHDNRQTPLTQAMGFRMMGIGVSEITEKNVDEVFARMALQDKLHGALLMDGEGKDLPVTPAMVEAYIGLRINAADITRSKLYANMIGRFLDDQKYDFAKYKKSKAEVTEALKGLAS